MKYEFHIIMISFSLKYNWYAILTTYFYLVNMTLMKAYLTNIETKCPSARPKQFKTITVV